MAKYQFARDYGMMGESYGIAKGTKNRQFKKGEVFEGRIVINPLTKAKTVHFREGGYEYNLPLGEFASRAGAITILVPYVEKRIAPDSETEQAADDEMVMDFRGEGWRKYATSKNFLIGGLTIAASILGYQYFKNR